jgi:transposase
METGMELYVGLDVSLKQTAICVVDGNGKIISERMVVSDPDAITDFVRAKAAGAVRVGLETGPTSTWLWGELKRRGLPVICIGARHARAALKMQINKSDRNDAFGIARIMQTGWYKQVHVKTPGSHAIKALLVSRALLVKIKRDIENQIRGLLKNLGLVIGRAKMTVFCARTEELIQDRPEIAIAVRPLLEARKTIEQQIAGLDRKVMKLARSDSHGPHFYDGAGHWTDNGTAVQGNPRRSHAICTIQKCWRLSRIDAPTPRLRRDRLDGTDLQMRRRALALLSVRSRRRSAHPRAEMVGIESLGHAACPAQRAQQGQSGGGAQACCRPASHVGRRHAVQLAGKGGSSLTEKQRASCEQRETLSLPGRCGGEIALIPASA